MYRTMKILLTAVVSSTLLACVSGVDGAGSKADTQKLKGSWRVEDIDQGGVIDFSMVTLQFLENSRIAGSTGCNRYNGKVEIDAGDFVVSQASSTRRACIPAIANQEQRFLSALNDARSYVVDSDTWLIIYDALDRPRLKLIEMTSAPEPQGVKLDQSQAQKAIFQCAGLGTVSFRFLGPETAEVSINQQISILQRSPAASGAQYSSEDMTFWNQGKEARLSLKGRDYQCVEKPQ